MGMDARTLEDPSWGGSPVRSNFGVALLFENKIHGQNKKHESDKVVYSERFSLEKNQREQHENYERNYFLNYFQFNQRKRATIGLETNPVCWHL
jgi:hypothetical protein